ncbi:MAG: hypothetical protein HJJLKODD_01363 [Phycisphaerae bacterium]|nr:hypothetical protein [Phycisphaerae bacterium]
MNEPIPTDNSVRLNVGIGSVCALMAGCYSLFTLVQMCLYRCEVLENHTWVTAQLAVFIVAFAATFVWMFPTNMRYKMISNRIIRLLVLIFLIVPFIAGIGAILLRGMVVTYSVRGPYEAMQRHLKRHIADQEGYYITWEATLATIGIAKEPGEPQDGILYVRKEFAHDVLERIAADGIAFTKEDSIHKR